MHAPSVMVSNTWKLIEFCAPEMSGDPHLIGLEWLVLVILQG